MNVTISYLVDSAEMFHRYKKLAEDAMSQVTDKELTTVLDDEMNSIALIVKHMTGNMRSRWTDFLTSDGEKPNRDRDSEFVQPPDTRATVLEVWNEGWALVFAALDSLTEEDMGRIVRIRGQEHSVLQAIHRQVAHYAYHCGQIVLLAKHFRGRSWKSLTIPRKREK